MDPRHRQILQQHRVDLVSGLNTADLCDGLLSKGIFTQDMIEEIQSKTTNRDKARKLLIDLETRGSRAFQAFLESLRETEQHHFAELLEGGPGAHQSLPTPVQPSVIPLPVKHPKPTDNPDRPDVPPLMVKPLRPPDSLPLLKPISPPSETQKLTKQRHDSIQASHNRFPGAVHGVDGPSVPVQIITNFLNGQNCPSLQGKPKLFFIQACGGDNKDTGFEVSPDEVQPSMGGADDQTDAIPMSSSSDSLSTSDEVDARPTLPTPSDILVSYSTFPGYVSWRDPQAGSWYVENLDRVLEQNADMDDLVTMLVMVNGAVSQISAKGIYKQMPGSFNFLRKRLYFQTPKS
nr:caspase-9 isoform X2 [Misgurnus anguillicaudatus]